MSVRDGNLDVIFNPDALVIFTALLASVYDGRFEVLLKEATEIFFSIKQQHYTSIPFLFPNTPIPHFLLFCIRVTLKIFLKTS